MGTGALLLGLLVLGAGMSPRTPRDAAELHALGESGDASAIDALEAGFDRRLATLREFPEPLFPSALESELVACLESMERLGSERALSAAREVLSLFSSDTAIVWAARRAVARSGDLDMIRGGLQSYFDHPEQWRRVLAEATAATGDVRLRDFRAFASARTPVSERLFRTRLERRLAHEPKDRSFGVEPPVLESLAAAGARCVRFAADKALLSLGAAGTTAFLRSELARGDRVDALLATVSEAPLEARLVQRLLERVASSPLDAPDAFAALFRFHERHPDRFLSLLSDERVPLVERARFVMSLSGNPRRLPLLVELAFLESAKESREAAFSGLAEAELGIFDKRLHRLAGHPDRRVRFLTAAALVPSGEPWAMRLLVAELDGHSAEERFRARRAIARLPRARARSLLEAMIRDGTANVFAIGVFLDLASSAAVRSDEELQSRMWELLAGEVSAGDGRALLAASRLSHPEAIAAVERFLSER